MTKRKSKDGKNRQSGFTFFAAFAAFALLSPLQAQEEPKLSLGPGTMTYPEIAVKLSVDGRVVQCARALQYRAAYVYLKERPWTQITDLLSKGLGVRFRADEEGKWLMEYDPATTHREDKWQRKIAALLRQQAQKQLAPVAGYLNRPYATLQNQFAQMQQQYEVLARQRKDVERQMAENAARGRSNPAQNRALQSLITSQQTLQNQMEQLSAVLSIDNWFMYHMLRENNNDRFFLNVVKQGKVQWTKSVRDVPYGYTGDGEGWVAAPLPSRLRFEVNFYPREFQLQISITWERLGYLPNNMGFSGVMVPFNTSLSNMIMLQGTDEEGGDWRVEEIFNLLGTEAVNWFKAESQTNKAFSETERAKKLFDVPPYSTHLSQAVEAWSRQLDTETVMELWPLWEALWPHSSLLQSQRRLSLASLISGESYFRQEITQIQEQIQQLSTQAGQENTIHALMEQLKNVQSRRAAYLARREADMPWTFREEKGVLVVQNRLSFLERAFEFPIPAMVHLERKMERRGAMPILPLDAVLDYSSEASYPRTNWGSLLYGGGDYRGIPAGGLGRVRMLLAMLSRSLGRENLIKQLKEKGVVEMSLARVSKMDYSKWTYAIGRLEGQTDGAEIDTNVFMQLIMQGLESTPSLVSGSWIRYCTIRVLLEPMEGSTGESKLHQLTVICQMRPLGDTNANANSGPPILSDLPVLRNPSRVDTPQWAAGLETVKVE